MRLRRRPRPRRTARCRRRSPPPRLRKLLAPLSALQKAGRTSLEIADVAQLAVSGDPDSQPERNQIRDIRH